MPDILEVSFSLSKPNMPDTVEKIRRAEDPAETQDGLKVIWAGVPTIHLPQERAAT